MRSRKRRRRRRRRSLPLTVMPLRTASLALS
jgi:hypothetical protein